MNRTRDGLLDGALASIQRDGLRRLTMSGICTRSGVAKATLYNHFRTKPDVLAALVSREVDRVADAAEAAAGGTLADALEAAAAYVAAFAPGRVVAGSEPGALVPLLTCGDGPGWAHARQRAAVVLGVDPGHPVVDLTLVWLGSVLLAAPGGQARRATASLLAESAASAEPTAALLVAVAGGDAGDPGADGVGTVTAGTTGTST